MRKMGKCTKLKVLCPYCGARLRQGDTTHTGRWRCHQCDEIFVVARSMKNVQQQKA